MKKWTFLGFFEIERKTDILALAAFLIAFSSIILQIVAYIRGSELRLFPPDQVMLQSRASSGERPLLNVVAAMSYVNTGEAGYHGTVKRESVEITLGNSSYLYVWDQFVSSSSDGASLSVHVTEEAHPFPVNAGSSLSHETRFAPRRQRCAAEDLACLNWNFLTMDKFAEQGQELKQMRFRFVSEIFEEPSVCAACVVDVEPSIWTELAMNAWITVPCWEEPCDR